VDPERLANPLCHAPIFSEVVMSPNGGITQP
jgi:hypothetical protein